VFLAGLFVASFGYECVDGGRYGANGVFDKAAARAGVGLVLAPTFFLIPVDAQGQAFFFRGDLSVAEGGGCLHVIHAFSRKSPVGGL
jgi:hypothetical protein